MIKYKEEKMLFEQILISLMLFTYLTYSQIEINFHLTEWMKNEVHIQQNCLFISVPYTKDYNERQILSFCMSELPSKFHIKPNRMDSIFTFDESINIILGLKEQDYERMIQQNNLHKYR